MVITGFALSCFFEDTRADDPGSESSDAHSPAVERPKWNVGDRWVLETLTQKIQGRENLASLDPLRVRWRFAVNAIESIADHDCYRIDIECLAKGRIRPKTTIWCDKETLFLHQIESQVVVGGRFRKVQESYSVADGATAPVLSPLTALPLDLPVFSSKGSKSIGEFTYLSQPLPAGSKDTSVLRFAHEVKQKVQPATAKALKSLPDSFSKNLENNPVREIHLDGPHRSVIQLWQKGAPWPVYVDNGNTQAWLVVE